MTSPSLELQGRIVPALKGNSDVSALVGTRVYDRVKTDADFPYISMGPIDELSDDADCITGFEISLQIDCWSREVGFKEVQELSDAVRRALHDNDLPLVANALVYFTHRQTRIFRDPDGLTSHAAVSFDAFAEQP